MGTQRNRSSNLLSMLFQVLLIIKCSFLRYPVLCDIVTGYVYVQSSVFLYAKFFVKSHFKVSN